MNEYRVKAILKNENAIYDEGKKALIAGLTTATLLTMINYGNLGISSDSLRDILKSAATIFLEGGFLASASVMYMRLANMCKAKLRVERLSNDEVLEGASVEFAREYVVTKKQSYEKESEERMKVAMTTASVAAALGVVNTALLVPYGQSLDYGSIEQFIANLGSEALNVLEIGSLGATCVALLDKVNFNKESVRLDKEIEAKEIGR